MLPPELQQITVYSAGITASAKAPDAARAMVRALTTPEAAAIFKAKGLGLKPNGAAMRVIVTLVALLVATGAAAAAEIKALITTAMEPAIVELVPPFERAPGIM